MNTNDLYDIYYQGKDFYLSPDSLHAELFLDIVKCGQPGIVDEYVDYVLDNYSIEGDPSDCRAYLEQCGAWDDKELSNHTENLKRLIWLTGVSLAEGEDVYFSRY
jgi:hypothetical protein